jgi:hypothetical protein
MKHYGFHCGGFFLTAFFICFYLSIPANAWALQSHGPPEGLYVHQMAHVHFILALGYLYWDIRRSSFTEQGWLYLQKFCAIMLCWNVLAFIGHAVAGHIDANMISSASYLQARIQGPVDLHKFIFYVAKFDHFVLVPALFFLYIGMRSLYHSVEKHAGEAGR